MTIQPHEKCECGSSLPWHLFELGFGMSHICSCERKYECDADGKVVLNGTAPNPFTRNEKAAGRVRGDA